jgi:energy-coupling factor transport system substrate-specific component
MGIIMNKQLKIKDIVLIALLTALYMILYIVSMAPASALGAFGHAISPGICGLIAGSVIFFINRKIGKMWEFTIMTALVMGVFALMGGGYLPWFVTSMVTAVIADLIASRSNKTSPLMLAIASGIMHVGQAWGSIIPATFFLDNYRATWIARGQTAVYMDEGIKYATGALGVLSTVVTFALAFIGVYIGYFILKKHFKEGKNS